MPVVVHVTAERQRGAKTVAILVAGALELQRPVASVEDADVSRHTGIHRTHRDSAAGVTGDGTAEVPPPPAVHRPQYRSVGA